MSDLKTNLEEILQEKETKIIPANIKKDVQIFDVVGTYEGEEGIDTSDANATADDIIDGKTAYVNGQKIIGSITDVSGTFALASIPITSVLYESTSITGEEKDIVFLSNFFENSIDTNRFCLATQYPIQMYLGEDKYSDLAEIITLTPDKLKKDETVLGVTGTYEGEGGDDVSNYINMELTETEVRLTYLITNVPEIDTSNVTNMDYMFQNFANLTTIPQLDTSSVTSMRWMFYGCTGLTTIPQLNTSNVTNMIYMFQNCSSLTTIPLLNTSNVMEMYYMFSGCSNLTEIPQLDTSTATRMDYMFQNCKSLTTIPQLNTSNVVNMSYMFYGCTSLTTIPLIDTSSATNMWSMFSGCSNLTSVPQLNTSSATNMSTMFRNCSNLVTIPQLNMSNVTNVQNMFYNCDSLSDDSLNNILASLLTATSYTGTKTLNYISLSSTQATTCATLSNWAACEEAGWTTGY